ncbi:MAG: alpha/beta hydrolase [Rhodothermales bacterium]
MARITATILPDVRGTSESFLAASAYKRLRLFTTKPLFMKKFAAALGVLIAAGAAFLATGPRLEVPDLTLPAIDLPDDLDAFVADAEAQVPDVRPGTEKEIIWAGPATKAKTPLAVVYLHGFSASRGETRPLSDTLAARLGANLFYTRLAGHGRDADAMAEAGLDDWVASGYEALQIGRRLGEQVVLIGTSMGGALTTWLAAQNPPDLAAIVLISPAFGLHDPDGQAMLSRFARWPWGAQATRLMAGEYRTWEDADAAVRQYWTTPYRTEALLTLAQLIDAVEATDLSAIQTPVLIVYSTQDEVVSPEAIEAAYRRFGSERKQRVAVESAEDPGHHVIAGEILSPGATETVAAHILDFVQSVTEVSPDSTSYASSSSKR